MDEDAVHRCVTKFMLDTCRHKSEYGDVPCLIPFLARIFGAEAEAFTSGSSAEFRIKPMLSCIGDIDVMYTVHKTIAIPHGHAPPTKLPPQYQRLVNVFDIIDSHQPGYVYLRMSYTLTKNDNGIYVVDKIENCENDAALMDRRCISITQSYTECVFRRHFNKEIHNNSLIQLLLKSDGEPHGPALNATFSESLNDVYK